MVRAFLCIDISDQNLVSEISRIQQRLNPLAAKMKLVETNNIHFTLRFFGDTPLSRINQIKEQLAHLSIEPFEIMIANVGAFPNKRRPRVVWVGVTKNEGLVRNLKLEIDSQLREIGYEPEKRKYTPHATIARVRHVKDVHQTVENLEEIADESVGIMEVVGIKMMKSTLMPSGPIYDVLWTIP